MRQLTEKDINDIRQNFPIQACLPPPDLTVSTEQAQLFDQVYNKALQMGPASIIDYGLPYPKYLFLEYLAQTRGVMLHGSITRDIPVLKPIRLTKDASEFGDQAAIYATQDPLWALFFAVLDKGKLHGIIHNGAIHLMGADGALLRRYYYCLEAGSLTNNPWTSGAIYILPRQDFIPDPTQDGVPIGSYTLQPAHWIHPGEVQPLGILNVEPDDFPFLQRVWGYNQDAWDRRTSAESLAGFPFLDDPSVYPILPGL